MTDAAAQDAEVRLGVLLPSSLLEILRGRNGGPVADRWDAFPIDVPTSWSEDHVPLDMMMGIGNDDDHLSLLDTAYLVEEWNLPSPSSCFPETGITGSRSTTGSAADRVSRR